MAILVFENNAILANDIQRNLLADGYKTLLIREPKEVPEDEELWKDIELIVLDLMMGDADLPDNWKTNSADGLITGYVVYKNMCPKKNIPVLVITGLKDETLLQEVQKGISKCILLKKPIDYYKFSRAVKQLLVRH